MTACIWLHWKSSRKLVYQYVLYVCVDCQVDACVSIHVCWVSTGCRHWEQQRPGLAAVDRSS
ncbi:hypothetical protein JG688_00004787 [Phytophthora aleatoria]|uniref:Uncharacterized protein n=1 Tax=Phytophthora aleatoria TaxID=2496075 RepID=A0A8J5IQK1_9STRA|nr:hypothetical protein JG688_00004787 [Phytophthora aleatoria]